MRGRPARATIRINRSGLRPRYPPLLFYARGSRMADFRASSYLQLPASRTPPTSSRRTALAAVEPAPHRRVRCASSMHADESRAAPAPSRSGSPSPPRMGAQRHSATESQPRRSPATAACKSALAATPSSRRVCRSSARHSFRVAPRSPASPPTCVRPAPDRDRAYRGVLVSLRPPATRRPPASAPKSLRARAAQDALWRSGSGHAGDARPPLVRAECGAVESRPHPRVSIGASQRAQTSARRVHRACTHLPIRGRARGGVALRESAERGLAARRSERSVRAETRGAPAALLCTALSDRARTVADEASAANLDAGLNSPKRLGIC
ncbi:hypothetical protein B0H15DRAFT_825248 [Mycena belliarum]|uniref:Uncharacterized protein n=1 Tax=Mycena belliarum TaxID=1033014 RepID=A0AAD6XSX5_9AGAR|nr:hypothetical protein B0H15DRAFT_825248 [Mycena belliae]